MVLELAQALETDLEMGWGAAAEMVMGWALEQAAALALGLG
jgi:hypothetical protein